MNIFLPFSGRNMSMDTSEPQQLSVNITDNTNSAKPRIRLFPAKHVGPFHVYLRKINVPIKYLTISRKIFQNFDKSKIAKIEEISKYKVRVEFKSHDEANNFVRNDILSEYRKYILSDKVEISGIINLDDQEDVNYIMKSGVGSFRNAILNEEIKILEIFPLFKSTIDGNIAKKNYTGRAKVTFEGSILPNYVSIDKWNIPVKLFNPNVMSCKKCGKFNHTEKVCLDKCLKCKQVHDIDQCPKKTEICPHCSASHENLRECPMLATLIQRAAVKNKNKVKTSYAQAVANANKFHSLAANESTITIESQPSSSKPIDSSISNPIVKLKTTQKTIKRRLSPTSKKIVNAVRINVPKKSKIDSAVIVSDSEEEKAKIPPGFQKVSQSSSNISGILEQICNMFQLAPHWKNLVLSLLVPLIEKIKPILSSILSSIAPLILSSC